MEKKRLTTNRNNTAQSVPTWLKMQPEYIDTNFESLTEYLKNGAKSLRKDSLYDETLSLLTRRVNQYIETLSTEPLNEIDRVGDELNPEQKDNLYFGVRLLGLYLLTCKSGAESAHIMRAYLFQQLLLSQLCSPSLKKAMAEKAMDTAISQSIEYLGYSWTDLQSYSADVLANKIITYGKCSERNSEYWFEGIGSARLAKGKIRLMPCNKLDYTKLPHVASLSVANGKVEVLSPQGDRLKQSKRDDIDTVMKFTNEYIAGLKKVEPTVNVLAEYTPDDTVTVDVRIVNKGYNLIEVETVDPAYQKLRGKLKFGTDEKIGTMGCNLINCITFLPRESIIPTRYVGVEDEVSVFDMTEEFIKYVVEEHLSVGDEVIGHAVNTKNGNTMWMTSAGVLVHTQRDVHETDEVALLTIYKMNPNGYIYANYQYPSNEILDDQESRRECLLGFCLDSNTENDYSEQDKIHTLSTANLAGIARTLYLLQKSVELPRERYRILCSIAILCKMIGDEKSFQMVDFAAKYIRLTIYFAQGSYSKITELEHGELIAENVATDKRTAIVKILRNYDTLADEEFLENAIQGSDSFLAKLASLVLMSYRMKDLLDRPLLNSIQREILKMLSMDDESTTGLDQENGIYLGTEDLNKEFKTSIVYPSNNGMQPAPSTQKINVFKGVCAFLNSSTGGTLYLGVNDLGYVVGVQNDLTYLRHSTIDAYMRYINDEAKAAFGLDLMTCIRIVPMFDNSVVAIQVSPSEFKIARLEGSAYIRINAESRMMDEYTEAQILAKKRHFDQDKAKTEFALTKAMEGKRKAILHGYLSNNSEDKKDRRVEPFDFAKGHKHVWCFDCDSGTNKLFSLARIGNVEVTEDPWTNTALHKELKEDLFHTTGEKPTHIVLELDVTARNLLVEEFEGSEAELTDYKNGIWRLETDVYRIEGVGRFFMGLATHITIVDAPELKEYAKQYLQSLKL